MESPVCRVCLKGDTELKKLINVFETYDGKLISDQISYIVNIDIKQGDGLPDKICLPCVQSLETAYSFKRTCEESDHILRSALPLKEEPDVKHKEIEVKEEVENNEDDFGNNTSPVGFEPSDVDIKYELTKLDEEDQCETDSELIGEVPEQIDTARPSRAIDLQLECHDCGGLFKSKCKLRVHWKKEHMASQLICPNCKKACKTYKTLHSHIKKKPTECLFASKMKIDGVGKTRIFHCIECDYSAKRAESVLKHLAHHTGERSYSCELCGKRYTQLSSLIRHKEQVHKTRIIEMTCELCGKHVVGRSNVYRHKHSHNNIIKRYECGTCKKVLKTRKTLTLHMKIHNNIKDVSCDICSKMFYTRSSLYNHKQLFHFKSKSFKCDRCSYESIHHYNVSIHKKRHTDTNIPCEICGTFVENQHQLKIHMSRHDKKIKCMYCDTKVLRHTNLIAHLRRKHGIRQGNNKGTQKNNSAARD